MRTGIFKKQFKRFLEQQDEIVATYIYGSYASGKTTPLSDLDIALLLDNTISQDRYFDFRINFELRPEFPDVDCELDIVILNEAPPLLTYEILKNGELIHCRDKQRLVFFIAKAIQKYLDTKHLRSVQFEALNKRIKEGKFGHLKGSDLFSLEKIRALSAKIASTGKDEEK